MRNVAQQFLAANTILLMRKWNHACSLLVYVISVITPGSQRALTAFRRYYLLKNKLSDRTVKQFYWTRLSQNIVICQCLADQLFSPLTNHDILLNLIQ